MKLKNFLICILLLFAMTVGAQDNCPNLPAPAVLPDNGLERTPMCGWNSWQISGFQGIFPTETMIKTQTDAFVSKGLLAVYNAACGSAYIQQDGWWPDNSRDGSGNIQANLTNYPSGMGALVTYVHGKGMLFGIHTSPYTVTCSGFTASGLHEQADAITFATTWRVDQIKYDGCNVNLLYPSCYNTKAPQIWQYFDSFVQATGHPVAIQSGFVPSPWGGDVWDFLRPVGVNQVRVKFLAPDFDIGVSWAKYDAEMDMMANLAPLQVPGYIMDADLEPYNWTGNQRWTHFALTALWSSPILITADLTTVTGGTCSTATDPSDLYVYCNAEVIAVDQDKAVKIANRINHTPCGTSWCDTWVKPLSTGQYVIGLVNRDTGVGTQSISVSFANYGGTVTVRDLYAHTDLGTMTSYSTTLNAYGTRLLLVTPVSLSGPRTTIQRETTQRMTIQ